VLYIRTGICLVGSSSNSVERVLSYFEKKYLFLDFSFFNYSINKHVFKYLNYGLIKHMPEVPLLNTIHACLVFCHISRNKFCSLCLFSKSGPKFTNTPAGGSLYSNTLQINRFNFIRSFSTGNLLNGRNTTSTKLSRELYKNVYEGRGIPNPEPFWANSNDCPVSMFGAS